MEPLRTLSWDLDSHISNRFIWFGDVRLVNRALGYGFSCYLLSLQSLGFVCVVAKVRLPWVIVTAILTVTAAVVILEPDLLKMEVCLN